MLFDISIHAPRTGSDWTWSAATPKSRRFQSTLPARGATGNHTARTLRNLVFQSTLPARGATGRTSRRCSSSSAFQSTLPARGATDTAKEAVIDAIQFQSTLPARGATNQAPGPPGRMEKHFNPRSPHGERLVRCFLCLEIGSRFQSTLPARGATARQRTRRSTGGISIHAPRTGSDIANSRTVPFSVLFQSTLPARGATIPMLRRGFARHISIHAPRTGSDDGGHCANHGHFYFNPRSPHGERPRKVTILSIRIIGFAQKVYHKTVLLRISLAENAVILPEKPRNPVRTSLQKAGGLRFARAIRAARPYSISSPSGA